MSSLDTYIKEGWVKARTTANVERGLDLPYPFVPPAMAKEGIHRTLYYWDAYFTNIGLIADGHTDWAKDNTDDLRFALRHFGCVPNYTRKDGADFCSQPPLLSLMVKDIYKQTNDEAWLAEAVADLEKEYRFWMEKRITPIGLNQHGCNAKDEAVLLGYYEYVSGRVALPQDISSAEKMRVAQNFVAEAESGEDYTPRYAHHNALDYVQIDLNSHLYGLEGFLAAYFADKDTKKAAYYTAQQEKRLALIEKYCFNEETGVYCDYDFVSDKKNDIISAACFLPYFYGFANKKGDVKAVYAILKTKGGVSACQDTGNTQYQWGYPYIWAPHQYFAYKALINGGEKETAEELRTNYTRLLVSTFDKTGALWERYDENGPAAELEYPTQKMLGWTAGVYRYFALQRKDKV